MADITGAKPVNNAVISTNIKIKIGTWTLGYIRSITETQARPSNPQYEVGTVGPIDMIPAQPAAVTLACAKVAIYGGNMINVIANALNSVQGTTGLPITTAPGLTQEETAAAMKYWLGQKQASQGDGDLSTVFTLADLPVGFEIEIDEIYPGGTTPGSSSMITKYHNCWIVRYTRPIVSSGDLLIAETADINAQYASYTQGRKITAENVEVVNS
jgi:hypothetical protein